jgi:hypothetical protein
VVRDITIIFRNKCSNGGGATYICSLCQATNR